MQAALLALNVIILLGIVALYLRKQNGNYLNELRTELEKTKEDVRRLLVEQATQNRQEANVAAKLNREELAKSIGNMNQSLINNIGEVASQQKNLLDSFSKRLSDMTAMNETKLERIRGTVEEKLVQLQQDNNQKLEQMRATVDEKLHATLEQRLGDSFKLVSERLELVHKGLGEMQTLANGVGDLRKVLTNVKTRGTLGELQLENLLDQTLTVEQYDKNVITKKGSNDRVEFAVKIPDKNNKNQIIHLPIDSKFPLEDYHRLLDAYEEGNSQAISENTKLLDTKIKNEAKSIRDKYIDPPNTTDFAIMFCLLKDSLPKFYVNLDFGKAFKENTESLLQVLLR